MSSAMVGILAALAAAISWAFAAICARIGMRDVASRGGTAVATIAGTVVVLAIALAVDAGAMLRVTVPVLGGLVIGGILQFPLGRLMHFIGVRLAGAAPSMTLASAAPLYAAFIAILFLGERLTWRIAAGTAAVVLGLAMVVRGSHRAEPARPTTLAAAPPAAGLDETSDGHATSAARACPLGRRAPVGAEGARAPGPAAAATRRLVRLGLLAATLSAVAFGMVQVIARHYGTLGIPPQVQTAYMGLVGMVGMSLLAGREWGDVLHAPRRALWALTAAGILSSMGVFLNVIALAAAPIVLVSPISGTSPLFVVVLTWLLLRRDDVVTVATLVGAAMTVGGVALVIVGQH